MARSRRSPRPQKVSHYRFPECSLLVCIICLLMGLADWNNARAVENQGPAPAKSPQGADNIRELVQDARHAYDLLGPSRFTDSLCRQALQAAEMTYDDHLILETYNTFLECSDIRNRMDAGPDLIAKALRICQTYEVNELHWRTLNNISKYHRAAYDPDKALAYAYKAFTLAELLDAPAPRVYSYLAIGEGLEARNERLEAFRHYLNAMNLALEQDDPELLRACYQRLSFFYNVNKMYSKAMEYKLKETEVLQRQALVDSTALYGLYRELEEIGHHSRGQLNVEALDRILDYAHRHQAKTLHEEAMTLYRAHFILNLDLKGLRELYVHRFPDDLNTMRESDPEMYYRVRGYLFEAEGAADSAISTFQRAAALVGQNPNVLHQANFHIRFAEMLERLGRRDLLPEQLELARARAEEGGYLPFMLTAVSLSELYAESCGDYATALKYARQGRALSDSLAALTRSEELFLLEIENAAQLSETARQRAEMDARRMRYIQYTAITISLVFIFFIVLTLGSLAIKPWIKRLMSFLSFVMLFEFLILILDHPIHDYTHGEPWKVLGIKIVIIAILLPLHHGLEHRLTNYLIARRLRLRFPELRNRPVKTRGDALTVPPSDVQETAPDTT